MLGKITNYFKGKKKMKALKNSSPEMIYGYIQGGQLLADTRVGSSTSFVGKENLKLADNVFIGQYNFIEASNGITIEEGCQITNYISILSHSSHVSIRLYGDAYRQAKDPIGYVKGEVSIGKYSFIGPHVTIMPGTAIGKGCLVSAYSMLKGDYPDFSIVAGNPAKVVGDIREGDKKLLEEHPELLKNYDKWANE
jgi:acetyltransferase-like isoleucine patch superfamily enzyme|tara:strand:+ start:1577 stop:2161 length:585 start_codon:yes stop_codon:yes gene_type:complete